MMKTEAEGSISLTALEENFVEIVAAKTVAKVSNLFSDYLKDKRFEVLFDSKTGETRKSIGVFRSNAKNPAYIVKAGLGIPGNLNYLAGLYRGEAVSRSGKKFAYARPRDLINTGWTAWGGDRNIENIYDQILKKVLKGAGA